MRILVAEDNLQMLNAVIAALETDGYEVDGVRDGNAALENIRTIDYDGIILDIMMPGRDGYQVLEATRKAGNNTPALFLTAMSDVSNRVKGLDAGADDYISKPFAISELLARVRAMLRRREVYTQEILSFNGLELDCSAHAIEYQDQRVMLSGKEFQIMEYFMLHPRTLITSERLLHHVWAGTLNAELTVAWVHTSNVRKKLKSINAPVEIRTERGSGYILDALC